ncbi:alpha/beta fold hydrolase [Streptomyces cylindrosporus]|uniref:Alpha/beta hydrolase n=1 Tax=Streptomyces cylindrosporus TaxID=2927583 RepID=A0ABS9Y8A3_9ACTN|nr:alpha/beta hydrolase [Streptomyces cylindrosporus]MCI3273462.1 alpha/beta hydrolase [Streptomyces cylindrosporus]
MTLVVAVLGVKGRPTEVREAGTGEPLVFLHGGGVVEGFGFLGGLAERFRVVVPLLPGYGSTELDPPVSSRREVAEHTRDVLDALGVERAVLVGHSMGGWRAAHFAALFPERVSRLVLGAPWGMDVPGHPSADLAPMSPAERLAALTTDPRILEGRFPTGPDPEFQAARVREHESRTRYVPGDGDHALADVLAGITAPTLLLWGEEDAVNPLPQAAAWQKALPHATLRTFPGRGHLLFHEDPGILQAAVHDTTEETGR